MIKHLPKRSLFTTVCMANLCLAGAIVAGCSKDESAQPAATAAVVAPIETQALIAQVGIEPGAVIRPEGPAAVIAASVGTIEVRRLGEESFAAIRNGVLYPGDQVRVGDDSRATLLFVDQSTVEVAEVSTLVIGSRTATADPASSAALLHGVARFTATPRSAGEGPFVVFTPAGVVATKGTVFAVGVAASGAARVGVESGAVSVAGSAALDAPVDLDASSALELAAAGRVGAKSAFPSDDWGAWRDRAEAKLDVAATAALHTSAMTELGAELEKSYGALATLGAQVAEFEAQAALAADNEDSVSYQASLPAGEAAIEAAFLSGLRLEWLTHAYAAHAAIVSELYMRHPETVVWANVSPRVDAAVLWPKRFDATAALFFEPLRLQYYVHHVRGRMQAPFVGVAIPEFFAKITPPAPAAQLKLGFKLFVPPVLTPKANDHAVWIAAPTAGWHAQAKAHAAAPRGQVAFWIKPPKLRADATLGAAVKAKAPTRFELRPAVARADLKSGWKIVLGEKIKLDPPNLGAAASARSSWTVGGNVPGLVMAARGEEKVELPTASAQIDAKVDGKAKGKLKAQLKAAAKQKSELEASAQRLEARAKSGEARAKASAEMSVKRPVVKAPKVSGSLSASSSLSLGL